MPLLQISEPDSEIKNVKYKIALGIDLGTTNSLAAIVINDTPTVLSNLEGDLLTPSIVNYSTKNPVVGYKAATLLLNDPTNTIVSVKRFMGVTTSDLNMNNYPYKTIDSESIIFETQSGNKTPIDVSCDILKKIKYDALIAINKLSTTHIFPQDTVIPDLDDTIDAVITVPAYFSDTKRQMTKRAAAMANINVLRILNEPTSAILAYNANINNGSTYLVFDLGGGTLDVSIIKFNQGVFEVIAVNGNNHLGGDDFDQLIQGYIISILINEYKLNNIDINFLILQKARLLKELLTNQTIANTTISIDGIDYNISITRDIFLKLSSNLVNQAINHIKLALIDAQISKDNIDSILLVGGSSQMPIIQNAIAKYFGRNPILPKDPSLCIAKGAAILANKLIGNENSSALLVDVVPLSLGIETMGGVVEKIIYRNSPIPTIKHQDFTTHVDYQSKISIHILQGENNNTSNCRSLAKFNICVEPKPKGITKIRVTFRVDVDGILIVSAVDTSTNQETTVEIAPSFGLNLDTINQML